MEKILIVDDDPIITKLFEQKFNKEHCSLFIEHDPLVAMDILCEKSIDLLIVDVMMPKISGITFISMVRELKGHDFPIIIISSLGNVESLVSVLGLSPEAIFKKPIDFTSLIQKVKLLGKYKC